MTDNLVAADGGLSSFIAKLTWTRDLFEVLKGVYDSYFLSRPIQLIYTAYPAEGLGRFRIGQIRQPPPYQLLMLAADLAHNARTALDQLAFALARVNTPSASDRDLAGVSWPIHLPGSGQKATHLAARTKLLPMAAQERIEQLQPYNVRSAGSNPVVDRVRLALGCLHKLDRIDRHRQLNLTFMGTGSLTEPPTLPAPYVARRGSVIMGPLVEGNEEFASWEFAGEVPATLPADLDLTAFVPLGLCFPELVIGSPLDQLGRPNSYGLLVYDLVNTMALCLDSVERTIPMFLPCFRGQDPQPLGVLS